MTESTSASAFIANESHMLFPASFSFFSTVPQAIIVGIDEHWKPAYWNERKIAPGSVPMSAGARRTSAITSDFLPMPTMKIMTAQIKMRRLRTDETFRRTPAPNMLNTSSSAPMSTMPSPYDTPSASPRSVAAPAMQELTHMRTII